MKCTVAEIEASMSDGKLELRANVGGAVILMRDPEAIAELLDQAAACLTAKAAEYRKGRPINTGGGSILIGPDGEVVE